jgi:pimeloyl-ACP methyl ester carboxylesterase
MVSPDSVPLIVCLHGMTNSSYMWADIADLLTDFEQGPQARVLVFDFYGRGRSPWTGVNITLDTLVTQTKELLDFLGLVKKPAAFIGYDLGGSVAAGFAAKYPNLCASLSLIDCLGIKYKTPTNEKLLNRKYIGEYVMSQQKTKLPAQQENEFFDKDSVSTHRYLIDKQIAMVKWQIKNTPGYLGAILSTYRFFPLRGMEELYTAIGRHPRKAMIMWGDHDTVCPYRKCVKLMEESFPRATIVDVLDCGHNCCFEKFEDVVRELLSFNKEVFEGKN